MNRHGKRILTRASCLLALVLAASLVLCPQITSAQSYVFGRADFAVQRSAYYMVTADFNGDGIPDFAVISESPTALTWTVSILLGRPDGSVGPITDYPLSGALVGGIIAADLNGDGKIDLAVTMPANAELSVLLGKGDGTFLSPVNSPLNEDPRGLAAGDFNGDGKMDLAVADYTDQVVSVVLGNGDGTFQGRVDYPVGTNPNSVAIGDFNGDGKLDLAVANGFSNNVSILLGNGHGAFQTHVDYLAGSGAHSIQTLDLNGDGKLDLVVANFGSPGGVSVLLGKGDGTFAANVGYSTEIFANSVTYGDFNGDGKTDLVVTNTDNDNVSVLLGNGDGTFQTAVNYATGLGPSSVGAVDFNGDGKLDLAILNGDSVSVHYPSIAILLGRGDGTFYSVAGYPAGSSPTGTVAADFNGDGKLDLAITDFVAAGGVSVLLGTGNGTFPTNVQYPTGDHPSAIAVGDFNGDKKLDLVVGNSASLSVLLGKGDGTFQPAMNQSVGAIARSVVVGDFNGDGKPDLAVLIDSTNAVSIFLGKGDGTFSSPVTYAAGNFPIRVISGDFNGDGKIDLAVLNDTDETISVLLGKGDGSFQNQVVYPAGSGPSWITAGDFNGDGKLDLVVANQLPGISVFLGNGDGTFSQTPLNYQLLALDPDVIAAGDFNGDGKLDLAVGCQGAALTLLLGNGDGTFYSEIDYAVSQPQFYMAVGDFNGDGGLDVAAPNLATSAVDVYLSAPAVALYPTRLAFAAQSAGATSPSQAVTLTNPGAIPVTISNSATAGDFEETNTCGSPVAGGANASCTFSVAFKPTAVGARTGALTIADDVAGSPQMIALSGTGTPGVPLFMFSASSLTFTQIVGSVSAAQPLTLSNNGGATLTITGSISVTGDFAETDDCGGSVAAGSNCTINVTFKPTATGARTGTLSVSDNAAGSPHTVALSGTGADFSIAVTAGAPTSVSVNPGQPASYQLTVTGVQGFTGQVSFACAGAPGEAMCAVSQNPVTLNGTTPVSLMVNLTTTAPSNGFVGPGISRYLRVGPLSKATASGARVPVIAWVMIACSSCCVILFVSRRRFRVARPAFEIALLLVVLCAALILPSCGGSGGGGGGNAGTPAGTYTLTVTATLSLNSATATHSQSLTLVVQ
jgi:hypothetical protein